MGATGLPLREWRTAIQEEIPTDVLFIAKKNASLGAPLPAAAPKFTRRNAARKRGERAGSSRQ
jgi:hypothetical protein